MDMRPINFIATVIGWAVMVIGAIALLCWGIDSLKLSLSEGQRFVTLMLLFGVIVFVGLYLVARDWFQDQDKNEKWLEESRTEAERRNERDMYRLKDELLRTRKALNEASAETQPKDKPRAPIKPKQ